MFDNRRLIKNKIKAQDFIVNSSFYEFIISDIIDRLEPIERKYSKILIISFIKEENIHIQKLEAKFFAEIDFNFGANIQELNYPQDSFDLIIFPFGLHWISEVQIFLALIKKLLKKEGIFICNFAGAGTLNNLRKSLLKLEIVNDQSHFPHISPFIQFEHITPLLQQAGFGENIIDMESVELEYKNILSFMHAIKKVGDSNALSSSTSYYSITKKMYSSLLNQHEVFNDYINLISFLSSPTKNSIKLKSEHFQPG